MNINSVYLAKIYVKFSDKIIGRIGYHSQGIFVKEALVYKEDDVFPTYVDLETGEEYTRFDETRANVGELYISLKHGLIPINQIIETKKENMSKRKILKNYKNTINNGGKNV